MLIVFRGQLRYLDVANVGQALTPYNNFPLTSNSAEVNIGIIAACIPTLLPLYRLIRDKFSIAGQNSSLNLSRFTKLLFGQTSETNTIARKPLSRHHKRDPSSALEQGERKDSTSHPFTQIGRDGYEDIEMEVGILGHE